MTSPETAGGPTFACHECGHRFPPGITVGVVGAHFEADHPGAEMAVDLVEENQ